jgi:hypothetical protein
MAKQTPIEKDTVLLQVRVKPETKLRLSLRSAELGNIGMGRVIDNLAMAALPGRRAK